MNGRGALDHEIKPLDPSSRFVGSALTARAGARDNLAALAALDLIEPGDVLVIATQGFTGTATLGDNMARIAQLRGAVALVTDGMVRDAAEIIALGIPCFCRGVTPNSAFPSGPGEVGLPLALGEVAVDAGDLVHGRPRRRGGRAAGRARRGHRAASSGRRQGGRDARQDRRAARSARCSTASPSCATRSRTSISGRCSGRAVPGRAGQRGTTLR